MAVAYISDHVDAAVDRLLETYKNKPNVVALVQALAGRAQVVENVLQTLTTGQLLVTAQAVGNQLDAIGAIVGIPRNGLSDSVYYILILGTIAKNYSSGSTDTIVTIVRDIFQAKGVYISTPNAPGHVREEAYGEFNLAVGDMQTDTALLPTLVDILTDSISAGVRMIYIASFETSGAFACDGPQPWVRGCSDVNGNGGGLCAGILYAAPTT